MIYAESLPGHDQNGQNGCYMIELVESVLKMGCPIGGYLRSFHKQIKLKAEICFVGFRSGFHERQSTFYLYRPSLDEKISLAYVEKNQLHINLYF